MDAPGACGTGGWFNSISIQQQVLPEYDMATGSGSTVMGAWEPEDVP